MPQPTQMEIATDSAVSKLKRQGRDVKWIGLQKFSVDGKTLTLTQLLKLATYGKID